MGLFTSRVQSADLDLTAGSILKQLQEAEIRDDSIAVPIVKPVSNLLVWVQKMGSQKWLSTKGSLVPVVELMISVPQDKKQAYEQTVSYLNFLMFQTQDSQQMASKKISAYDTNDAHNQEHLVDYINYNGRFGFVVEPWAPDEKTPPVDHLIFRLPSQVHLYGEPDLKRITVQIQALLNKGKGAALE